VVLNQNLQLCAQISTSSILNAIRSNGNLFPKELVFGTDAFHFTESYILEKNFAYPPYLKITTIILFSVLFLLSNYYFFERFWFSRQVNRLTGQLGNFGILVLNSKGKVRYLNNRFCDIFSLPHSEFKGKKLNKIFEDASFHTLNNAIRNTTKTSSKTELDTTISIHNETRHLKVILQPFYIFQKIYKGIFILFNDTSDIVKFERTANWAAIAQKIAHDIKSPLSVILLSLQKLQYRYKDLKIPEESEFDNYVKNAREEILRIQNLTKSFLKFANLEKPNLQPVDVPKLIDELLLKYTPHFQSVIELRKDFEDNLPYALADESQLRTALSNIIENSLNAMEGKGVLKIRVELAQKLQSGNTPVSFILVSISDNGMGIAPDKLEKVFEPYFTTNENGTGFGLTITKKIIEDQNGSIDIHSKIGLGTTVCIWIPIYQDSFE